MIGAGRIGQVHARNIKYHIPQAELAAISDLQKEIAEKLAGELDVPFFSSNYQDILNNHEIDAIIICSSTDTHSRIIIEAAEARKHIFCEKPIALEMDEIEQALRVVEEQGVIMEVGFNRRFDPSFRKAHDMIANGDIGKPRLVKITSRDPEPPPLEYVKVSGGIFLDMAVHDFDMARFIIGTEVKEVFAFGECLIDPAFSRYKDVDTAITNIRYSNGVLGVIDNSRQSSYGYDNRIEVLGSKGCIIVGNRKPTSVTLNNSQGITQDKPLYFFVERYREAYIAEMEDFISAIMEGNPPGATGLDGKIAMQIGYAARRSLNTRRFEKVPGCQEI